jgi:hypothetical protein
MNLEGASVQEATDMPVNTDPEQTLTAHLLKELKPECGCAVCAVLREWFDEAFTDAAVAAIKSVAQEATAPPSPQFDDSTPIEVQMGEVVAVTPDTISDVLTKRFAGGAPGSGLTMSVHEAHALMALLHKER